MRAARWMLALLALTPAARAATPERAHRVLAMVYDIGLYQTELDRIMDQAASRGIYGGAGSSPASRARDRTMTRSTMIGQREAVLNAATIRVAAKASDPQLDVLLSMSNGGTGAANPALVDSAVAVVKAGFEDALWDQLARTARGNAEFPCTKDARNRC